MRGIINNNASMCAICNKEIETVDHLFLSCYDSWRIWNFWIDAWGRKLVILNNIGAFTHAWNGVINKSRSCPIWRMAFFYIIWTIWLSRNDLIFKDIVREPSLAIAPLLLKKVKPMIKWVKPPCGCMKFNVNGATRGCPREAGSLLFFFFVACSWAGTHELIVESDSSNVVKWINNPPFAQWRTRSVSCLINNLKCKFLKWKVVHTPRSMNQLVDCLAKDGVE
ncbi:Uncharacterized protein TCM_040642 [Theobroma cacao]|uniref:RNase H type-1 domain-containing protein n=1 Tax=Theobroma cacao TaxID=3641 RepID=A0A061GS11_THECC|nr:Uncharacterized protein TCM_040642 [Theobroma cacao]